MSEHVDTALRGRASSLPEKSTIQLHSGQDYALIDFVLQLHCALIPPRTAPFLTLLSSPSISRIPALHTLCCYCYYPMDSDN